MSFTPLMMKLIPIILDDLPQQPSVIELGNQSFDPTISNTLTNKEDLMFPLLFDFLDRRGKTFDRESLLKLMELDFQAQKPHTETFYKALGFVDYKAIDVNDKYGSLVMDLNVDLKENYGFDQTFDLVTNNGTGEHIFNQYAVFKNMHQLARVGGILLYVLPFYNWMNHGFFNFNPLLFTDLAEANEYEVIRLSIACGVGQEVTARGARIDDKVMRFSWQPDTPELDLSDFQSRGLIKPRTPRNVIGSFIRSIAGRSNQDRQLSKLPNVVESLAERVPNISIVAALRKKVDRDFAMPLQGMYSGQNVVGNDLRDKYRLQN